MSVTTLILCYAVFFSCTVPTICMVMIETITAEEGTSIVLRCNRKKPLNWFNKDNEIIGRQRGRIEQNVNGNLLFHLIQFSDKGVYTCSNIDGSVDYVSWRLTVVGAPNLVNISSVVDVENDKEAVVNCEAEGYPPPVITWFKYRGGQKHMVADGSTLNTRMTCKYCQVYFNCEAVNTFGKDSANITLNVVGKPEVNILEKSTSGVLGKNVTVHCSIKSNPPPQYMKWLKNGKLVEETKRKMIDFNMVSLNEMLISLSIKNLKKKDFGEYECLGVNAYGNETKKIQITLKSKKSSRKSNGKPLTSQLSASTELVISTEEKPKGDSLISKTKGTKPREEETDTQSSSESASANNGAVCTNSWKEFTVIVLLPVVISDLFFHS